MYLQGTKRLGCYPNYRVHFIARKCECPRKNMRMDPSQCNDNFSGYRDFHFEYKTVVRPPYYDNDNSYIGKTTSLYWNKSHVISFDSSIEIQNDVNIRKTMSILCPAYATVWCHVRISHVFWPLIIRSCTHNLKKVNKISRSQQCIGYKVFEYCLKYNSAITIFRPDINSSWEGRNTGLSNNPLYRR